jgi:hypothetical protein
MNASERCRHALKFRVVLKGAMVLPESRSPVESMRTMNIPPFPKPVEFSDIESLTNARLSEKFSLSEQAAALVEYMLYPTGEEARVSFRSTLGSSPDSLRLNLKGMRRIQYNWLRAADVFHLYYDLAKGAHQSRRGGATISKAVHLAAKNAKSVGTSEPTFWSAWMAYKDVALLVTATILIWANARIVFTGEYVSAFRTHEDAEPLEPKKLTPFHILLLMPDLVLGVGRTFEEFALTIGGRPDAGLDPETLWRIPANINVAPVSPPVRAIRSVDKLVLNARRAGNRGRRHKAPAGPPAPKPL